MASSKVVKNKQHAAQQSQKRHSLRSSAAIPPRTAAPGRAPQSLLQFGEPVAITKQPNAAQTNNVASRGSTAGAPARSAKGTTQPLLASLPGSSEGKQSRSESLPSDLIDILLPARQWTTADGQTWTQTVSREQSSRKDVLALHEMLDIELENNSAREIGIDKTRRKLYAQCLDECIRQTALEMPERGVLLWRIKKEFEKNVTAFAALLESSQAFGIRKTVLSKHGQQDLATRVEDLQANNERVVAELGHWKQQFDVIDKHFIEQRSQAEKLRQDEVSLFKRVNQQLKNQIEGIVKPKDNAQDK